MTQVFSSGHAQRMTVFFILIFTDMMEFMGERMKIRLTSVIPLIIDGKAVCELIGVWIGDRSLFITHYSHDGIETCEAEEPFLWHLDS